MQLAEDLKYAADWEQPDEEPIQGPDGGVMRYYVRECPLHHTCLQMLDVDYSPHIACKKLPSHVTEETVVSWGSAQEPSAQRFIFEPIKLEELEPKGGSARPSLEPYVGTLKRTIKMPDDLRDASLSIILVDKNMDFVIPTKPWHAKLKGGGRKEQTNGMDACTTWDRKSAACQPFRLVTLSKNDEIEFDVEISWWQVQGEKSVVAIFAIVLASFMMKVIHL